jgi:hypothetical protein
VHAPKALIHANGGCELVDRGDAQLCDVVNSHLCNFLTLGHLVWLIIVILKHHGDITSVVPVNCAGFHLNVSFCQESTVGKQLTVCTNRRCNRNVQW